MNGIDSAWLRGDTHGRVDTTRKLIAVFEEAMTREGVDPERRRRVLGRLQEADQ